MIQREKKTKTKEHVPGEKNPESRLNRQRHYNNHLKASQKAKRKVLYKVKKVMYE